MRTMWDSTNPLSIPSNVEQVAGYINGRYAWSAAGWARFPGARKVQIAIYIPGQTPPNDGDILDVEANDAPGARTIAGRWLDQRRAAGIRPAIYTSAATLHYLDFPDTDYWVADVTGTPHMYSGFHNVVATQYVFKPGYDLSLVLDTWPTVVPSPSPIPPPYSGAKYMFIPIHVSGLDSNGNGWWDVPVDSNKIVNCVVNSNDPTVDGYHKLPRFVGRLGLGPKTRLVFEEGQPNGGGFDATVIVDS